MRKFLTLFTVLMLSGVLAFSQERTISGVVTDKNGAPVPFATVQVVGTKQGIATDAYGKFIIKADANTRLMVSATGMKPQEITVGSDNNLSINLETSKIALQEVVVTGAFGIKNTVRNTSYSAQVVTAEQLNIVPHGDLNSALAGKIAGVQFRGQSAMLLDRQGSLRVRGALSLNGGDPVYVVDGTIVNSFDINPDDIQSLTVLKGANATALFGGQAASGAIVITTKKKTGKGLGIDFSQGLTFSSVALLPKYQNLYAGGGVDHLTTFNYDNSMPAEWKALDGKGFPDYTDDASWGPKMEGQEYIPWYAWFPGTPYSFKTAKLTPQPDNAKDFYRTGITNNTNLAFGKSAEDYGFRISYTNQSVKGMFPNSNSNKNTIFTTGTMDLNPHFTAGINSTFSTQKINGYYDDAYSNQGTGSFNSWFHRDLDINLLRQFRNLKSPLGTIASWNLTSNPDGYDANYPEDFYRGNYWYNPYTYYDNQDNQNSRNRMYGDVHLTYKLNNAFNIKATVRKNQLNTETTNITKSILEQSASQTGLLASYYTRETNYQEYNYELLGTYNNRFLNDDLDLNLNAGGNINTTKYNDISSGTVNGLNVPDLYSIANSKSQPSVSNSRQKTQTRSVFGSGDIGYKDIVHLNFGLRNDWYSTLPSDNNSLFSPSIGANVIFSTLTQKSFPALSFGKVFASWGKKPRALDFSAKNFAYTVGQYQWNGNFLMGTPDRLIDSALKGSLITSYEIGFDVRFIDNRFGLNFTYYHDDNNGEPVTVTIDGVSGYTSKLINAARIERHGIEAVLTIVPITNRNFRWEIDPTFGYLISNKVLSLAEKNNPGDKILASGVAFGSRFARMWQELNSDWGQLIGGGIARNDAGQKMILKDGTYKGDPDKHWGSVVPKTTGGLVNNFTYKDFNLNFSLDYQVGGKFFSLTENWGSFSGLMAPTAALNDKGKNVRDDVSAGGGVHVTGVDATDGKTPVDKYVDAQTYFHQYYFNRVAEPFIHDLTFVKLREISLGYNLPVKKMGFKWLQNASVSIIASNPWLIYTADKNFDVSEISYLSGEEGQMPSTRSIGFNLKLGF